MELAVNNELTCRLDFCIHASDDNWNDVRQHTTTIIIIIIIIIAMMAALYTELKLNYHIKHKKRHQMKNDHTCIHDRSSKLEIGLFRIFLFIFYP